MTNNNLIKQPILTLGAKIVPSSEISNFFEKQDNKFIELLANPHYLRYSGWNMLTLGAPQIKDGSYWEIKNGDRKTFRLYSDGTFVTTCYADSSFLGWGRDPDKFEDYPLINSIAIAEYLYEFVELYRGFLELLVDRNKVIFSFLLQNTKTSKDKLLRFSKYEVLNMWYGHSDSSAEITKDGDLKGTLEVRSGVELYDSTKVAFDLLSKMYLYANIPLDEIPYSKKLGNGDRIIDIQKIKGQT